MKIIVNSLSASLGPLLNAFLVIVVVWIIFAILGMNFMGKQQYYCDIPEYYQISKAACVAQGAVWRRTYWNFDNILESMVSLFVLSSLEGWPTLLGSSLDIGEHPESGPIYNNSPLMMIFYFSFIVISSLLLINVFIGVIFFEYNQETAKEKKAECDNITPEQLNWILVQDMIEGAQSGFFEKESPRNKFRKACFELVNHRYFEVLVMTTIVFNIGLMVIPYEEMSDGLYQIIENLNYIFIIVYFVEAFLKMIAYGSNYFRLPRNNFDLTVAIASRLLSIGLLEIDFWEEFFAERLGPAGSQLVDGFRLLRILRIFKLLRFPFFEKASKIVGIIMIILPSFLNVIALMFLVYLLFAILAVYLFKGVILGEKQRSELFNFETFHSSLLTLFRCSTGEDWPTFMYTYGETNYGSSRLFFILFIIVQTYILIKMLQLIVVKAFSELYFDNDNVLHVFNRAQEKFNETWNIFAKKGSGEAIHYTDITLFFAHLEY
jgi:hypothetical protein